MHRSTEVQWTLGPTIVDGTLVMPGGTGPFPAVVMAAGSGPTDRDWTSPLLPGTNGSASLIAAELAQAGFASLRYDKRVTGPHAVENLRVLMGSLSMQSHVDEYAGAVDFLAARADIRADQIFGLGNSEGTLHVLHYQLGNPEVPLAGIILAAPPGRPVGVVARSQLAAQAATVPNGAALLAFYDAAAARFEAGEAANPDPALPDEVKNLIAALESPANLPFSRELWNADTVPLLAEMTVPVLIIIGKKDLQVDWRADGEPLMMASRGKPHITIVFPPNANHVLKYEPQDRSALVPGEVVVHYNADGVPLDSETMDTIRDWLSHCVASKDARDGE